VIGFVAGTCERLDVLARHPSARTGARDHRQVDAEVPRQFAHGRRGGDRRRLCRPFDLERRERRPDGERLARRNVEPRHAAGERRGHLDRRLGRLDLDERLVQRDPVTLGDEPRAHDRLLETLAEIGQGEDALAHQ
jgi:hypothetical protein